MSKVTLIIGMRGTGKSTFNKTKLKLQDLPRDRLHIYDVQGEYFPNEVLPPADQFTEQVKTKRNCHILFEEATIFFPNRGYDKNMVHLLVSARHRGNMVYIVYHSLAAIPEYIYNLSDYMILFHTKDKTNKVEQNYETIFPHFVKLRVHPEQCLQLELLNGKKSPYVIIEL